MQIDVQFEGFAYMCEHHHSLVVPPVDTQKEGLTGEKSEIVLVILKNIIQVIDVFFFKE